MCGRFTLRTPQSRLVESFAVDCPQLPLRFNIAPSQDVLVVRGSDEGRHREAAIMRWGLIPSWAQDPTIGNRLINARAETVADKPSFRAAFKKRRCLVPADGYYEWMKLAGGKQPYYITLADQRPFAFAGLWEHWQGDDATIDSCAIITTDANERTRAIHDRMPVILPPDVYDVWLSGDFADYDYLKSLLRPYDGRLMRAARVSRTVNRPTNDSPECIEAIEPDTEAS